MSERIPTDAGDGSRRAAGSGPLSLTVAVLGGTGTVGAEAARELERREHAVRVLSRHAPEHAVDLRDGSGLAAALDGVDVVVNAANGDRDVLVDGTARLLRAAEAAGVRHYVAVSIVGIDRVGIRYYKAKLAQEELIRRSGVPWTIVRATQFHPFVARTFAAGARFGIVPCLKFPMQPVDPREVGGVLAETAGAEPSLAITQFAGPEVLSACELARRWRLRTGSHAVPVRLPVTRALRSGALTNPDARRGSVTFDEWLEAACDDPAVHHALNLDGFGAGGAIALITVLVSAPALPVLAIVIIRPMQPTVDPLRTPTPVA